MKFKARKIMTSNVNEINKNNRRTKLIYLNQGKSKQFIIISGPPFANGFPHMGHFLNLTYKNILTLAKNIYGFSVSFYPTWDAHGLPIEQSLISFCLNNKIEYSKFEKAKLFTYNLLHEASVIWIFRQLKKFKTYGFLSNLKYPWHTNSKDYIKYSINKYFELAERFIYRDKLIMPYDIKYNTFISHADTISVNEMDKTHYFFFKTNVSYQNYKEVIYIAIWTTTIWSIFGNIGLAYSKDIAYSVFKNANKMYISNKKIEEEDVFIGPFNFMNYENFEYFHDENWPTPIGPYSVYQADFIKEDDISTCIVHIAPQFAKPDYILYTTNKIFQKTSINDILQIEKTDIKYLNQKINSYEDMLIIAKNYLNTKSVIEREVLRTVNYFDRSKDRIIEILSDQVMFNVDILRKDVIESAKKSKYNNSGTKARFLSDIYNRPEWCLSRSRLYGLPIPNTSIKNIPYIKYMATNTIDCWYESGLLLAYTHDKINLKRNNIYLVEGMDQTRGWFQHQLIITTALNKLGYSYPEIDKYIIHGFVLDKNGQKMSKSRGNVIGPEELISKYGVDTLRIYFASQHLNKNILYDPEKLEQSNNTYIEIRRYFDYLINLLKHYDLETKVPNDYIKKHTLKFHLSALKAIREDNFINLIKSIKEYKSICSKYLTTYLWKDKDGVNENILQSVPSMFRALIKYTYIICPYLILEIKNTVPDKVNLKEILRIRYGEF